MPAPRVRADYDQLGQISNGFTRQASAAEQTLRKLRGNLSTLKGGDWIGQGAQKFYQEMDSEVLPAMQRLSKALREGARATNQISKIMKQAEEDAARVFQVDAAVAAAILGGGLGAGIGAVAAAGAAAAKAAPKGTVETVFSGTSSMKNAPATITLPKQLNAGMQAAWKDSFPKGHEQEQGGILVRAKDGTLKWVRGKGTSGANWSPNFGDIGDNKLIGTGHTHPYDSGHTDVPFSSGDIDDFFRSDLDGKTSEQMMMVQSGDGQFVLARTAEFNKLVEGKSAAHISKLRAEMTKTYNDAVAAAKAKGASFPARYDAAVKAVADKYHLLYYKGKGGNLALQ